MLGIVTLNWNGYDDTIECIQSIIQSDYQDCKVYLVDNCSSDGSQDKLRTYISSNGLTNKITIIQNNENLGFSIGSNIGIKVALEENCDYIWLLNNDTVIQENAITKLVNSIKTTDAMIVTPKIAYYSDKNVIWNCGGKISRLGFRKYYYADQPTDNCPDTNFKITFVTNCASLFQADYFKKYGYLSERFFFGEEDFEMSLRNLKYNVKMCCVPNAVIYHKVSRSIGKIQSYEKMVQKDFLYYLNRMVDMKLFFNNKLVFNIYFFLYSFYIKKLLHSKKYQQGHVSEFMKRLYASTLENDKVDKTMFQTIMNDFHL